MSLPSDPRFAVALHAEAGLASKPFIELAGKLMLPFLGEVDPRRCEAADVLLLGMAEGLSLVATGKKQPGPVRCEFVRGKADFRRKHGGGRGQLIAKAVGVGRTQAPLRVLDATAGFGQDAFVLAGLGCHMTLLERSPVLTALLRDGLERGAQSGAVAEVVARMPLINADARDWLADPATPQFDVIHIDPMFPHRDKNAQVKKEMQLLRPLVGDDEDADDLLDLALAKARYRVAVKRPRLAPVLAGQEPDLKLDGKSCRYDVYTLQGMR
ncbi:class I SAM-dependent methyltransferase [Marinobacteraceae bacterium S3BR75-40.1]